MTLCQWHGESRPHVLHYDVFLYISPAVNCRVTFYAVTIEQCQDILSSYRSSALDKGSQHPVLVITQGQIASVAPDSVYPGLSLSAATVNTMQRCHLQLSYYQQVWWLRHTDIWWLQREEVNITFYLLKVIFGTIIKHTYYYHTDYVSQINESDIE